MKKVIKKTVSKVLIKKIPQKSDVHIARQSINQKVERSEQDIKKEIQEILMPLSILICISLFLTFVLLGTV